jgi:hypothetical protein
MKSFAIGGVKFFGEAQGRNGEAWRTNLRYQRKAASSEVRQRERGLNVKSIGERKKRKGRKNTIREGREIKGGGQFGPRANVCPSRDRDKAVTSLTQIASGHLISLPPQVSRP